MEGSQIKKDIRSPTTSGERFNFIHLLRAVAALIVVWAHLSGFWLYSRGDQSALQSLYSDWVTRPFHILYDGGHMAVVLFFLISGFIITHVSLRESHYAFAVKRTMRIFPPLFVAILIAWILLKISSLYGTDLPGVHAVGTPQWIASLFLLDGWSVGTERALNITWTLVIEIGFYILVALFMKTAKSRPLRSQWWMTSVWVATSLLALNLPIISSTGNAGLIKYIAFLLLGRLIYLLSQRLITTSDALLNGSLLAYVFWAFTQVSSPGYLLTPGYEPIVSYLLAIGIFLGILRLAPRRIPLPFQFLGDISYSLYLLHLPVGMFVLNCLSTLHISRSLSSLIAISICIPIAYLAYKYVELPCLQLARKILASKRRLPRLRISVEPSY